MNDLSHEARSLLAVARNVTVPTEQRRRRIRHSVLLRVAAVTATSAGASVASATSLAGKLVLGSVLATLVTGGAYGVWRWRSSAEKVAGHGLERVAKAAHERGRPLPIAPPAPANPPAPQSPLGLGEPSGSPPSTSSERSAAARPASRLMVATRERDVATSTTPPVAPSAPGPVTMPAEAPLPPPLLEVPTSPPAPPLPMAEPTRPPVPPLPLSPAPVLPSGAAYDGHGTQPARATTDTPSNLVREVALLRRAHEALRDHKPQLALRVLGDYDREFPGGSLREERTAIEVIAACQAHPGPHARARAQQLLQQAPGAWLAERVRAACLPDDRAKH